MTNFKSIKRKNTSRSSKANLIKIEQTGKLPYEKYKDKIEDFFKWVKGTELVELDDIDVSEDPVRPELNFSNLELCMVEKYLV